MTPEDGIQVTLTLTPEQLDQLTGPLAERVAAILAGQQLQQQPRRWLTPDEAAEYLGSTRQRIYDLRTRGRLSRTGDGGRVLVDRYELDALIQRGLTWPVGQTANAVG